MLQSTNTTGIDIKSPLPDTSISHLSSPTGGAASAGGASCPPLDSLTISGTISRQKEISSAFKKAVKTRFSGNHWHTVQFRAWAEQAEKTVICHTCVEAPDENGQQDIGIYALPTTYAFAKFAGKRNQALVYSFAEAISGHSGVSGAPLVHFVTLTAPHDVTGSYGDMVQTVQALRAGWSGIRRYLHRWGCRYLRVIEPGGKRGYPHFHLIVLGLTSVTAEQLLGRWVSIVPGALRKAQDIQEVRDIENLGAYLTKTLGYVAKQWDEKRDSIHWWHYQELRYRMGIRDIAMDSKTRAYIAGKYKNPVSGLSCCGETKINWGDDQAPDLKLQISSSRSQAPDLKLQISSSRSQAPDPAIGRGLRRRVAASPHVSCYMSNLTISHVSNYSKNTY